jgi:hypothetical protein
MYQSTENNAVNVPIISLKNCQYFDNLISYMPGPGSIFLANNLSYTGDAAHFLVNHLIIAHNILSHDITAILIFGFCCCQSDLFVVRCPINLMILAFFENPCLEPLFH